MARAAAGGWRAPPPGTQLAPRNPGVRAWDELSPNAQKFMATLQEAFAGFLEHTDAQIGRLVQYLDDSGQLDNTILILLADNGASQEGGPQGVSDTARYGHPHLDDVDEVQTRLHDIGGPRSSPNYPWGWAQAGNTPLKWYKQNTHGGGVRVPMIVHWPERVADRGAFRRQFHHVSDVVPTVLELLGAEAPTQYRGLEQMPVTGTSFAYALEHGDAPPQKSAQYFEMLGHRGIYADGWKAVTHHDKNHSYDDEEWELYHLAEDFSESSDLAQEHPQRLRELVDQWWVEAGRNGVLPLDDRSFQMAGGATDQFYPELTHDNHPVDPPKRPEDGYHVTEDLVDHAIGFVSDQMSIYPNSPFFLYFALGAMHEPHHAPKEYIEKYRGHFDDGWDVIRQQWFERQLELGIIPPNTKLTPRNPGVKPWDELSQNERNFVCRLQETWAGFLEHSDAQIGRLIDYLESSGQLENTIVVLTADNGTSQNGGPTGVMHLGSSTALSATNEGLTLAESLGRTLRQEDMNEVQSRLDEIGGPRSFTDIPWGWPQVGNTPLKWYKQDVHGGGVRVPLIVHHGPSIKDAGGIREQFHHVSDVTPTILEMLGVEPRSSYQGYDQMPISGTSFAYTYEGSETPSKKAVQYFEMVGHRGIWSDGWKAVTRHVPGADYDEDDWELYHVAEDFSETENLAEQHPERLRALIDLWWLEAGRYGVLPLDDRTMERGGPSTHPGAFHENLSYRFRPPLSHVPTPLAPQAGRGDWVLTADIEVPDSSVEGVIFSQGSVIDGFALFVQGGRLCFAHKAVGRSPSGAPRRSRMGGSRLV